MPVLRKTLNLTLSGNRLIPVDASGQPDYDAGVQGENGAVALRFALPADWRDLSVNLYAAARNGAFDVASDANGAVTLTLPGGVLNTPEVAVHLEGLLNGEIRKTADCTLRVAPSATGVSRPVPFSPSVLQTLEDKIAAVSGSAQRGTKWFCGAGAPGTVAGALDGDFYLDTDSGNVYELAGSAWGLADNIRGPQGEQGDTGAQGPKGGTGPAGEALTLNGISGSVTLSAGSNVTVTNSGQTVTIAAGGGGTGAGTPVIRAVGSGYGTSGNAGVTVPGSAVPGDLLILFVGSNYGVAYASPPSGWALLAYTYASYHNGAVFCRTCAAGDAGSAVSIGMSGSQDWNAYCVAVGGAGAITGCAAAQATSGTTLYAGTALCSRQNDLALIFGSVRAAGSTVSSTLGSQIAQRSDANLCSAVFSAASSGLPQNATVMSSADTSGIAAALVTVGG